MAAGWRGTSSSRSSCRSVRPSRRIVCFGRISRAGHQLGAGNERPGSRFVRPVRQMRASVHGAAWFAAALAFGSAVVAQDVPDAAAAEWEYRLAQRLSAERSPDAASAFSRVVALAPTGPSADDALVDLACLSGLPDWPEDVATLEGARAAAAVVPLQKVVAYYADGDRQLEARYRLALIRMKRL